MDRGDGGVGELSMKTLYITDLDGTLLGDGAKLSDFTRDTINRLVDGGMNFTLATARSYGSAGEVTKGLKTSAPAVLMNGVFLYELADKRAVNVFRYPDGVAEKVIEAFRAEGCDPNVYSYTDDIDIQFGKDPTDYETEFFERRKKLFKVYSTVENYNCDNVIYINRVNRYDLLRKIADRIDKIDGADYVLYADNYSDYYFLEVFSAKANKKAGIELLRQMGYEKIVAFGDNYNDLGMFEAADVSVAVGNACDEVKNAADIVIEKNTEDGVAKFLLQCVEKA